MIFRAVQVGERDIAMAYDPTLLFDDYSQEDITLRAHRQRKRKEKQKKNKSTTPMVDKEKKQAEKEALEEKKREVREFKAKEKIREKKRIEKAKQRARKKKIKPKVICECKAREFKIIEARKHETLSAWNTWCPPDPAPEQEIVYERLVLTLEDLPPQPPPPPIETRDLMIQIDLPPIEPGTALSEEMYELDEVDEYGSVEVIENTPNKKSVSPRHLRRSITGVIVATSQDKSIHPSIPMDSKTPRPRPRSLYDTKPKPKPRVRAIIMQTDSDPGPLREQNIQYEKQCVCRPGPDSKCTCQKSESDKPCSCKTPSPLDGGPPCICKPTFGPGYRTRRRKKCRSRKCKKCREKGLSGRDIMAKLRTRDEKMKEEQEKIRIEKAKLKVMKQVQKKEGKVNRAEAARDKIEMKAAAERIKHQMREQDRIMKAQKRRELARQKKIKQQQKEQKRQVLRDEEFRRRLSEMRKPEAEFCGCRDWQKGLCKVKIPPDILAAQEALQKEQEEREANLISSKSMKMSLSRAAQTMAMAAKLARSIDNSDSEFILPTHRQSQRQETFHKYQNKADNYVEKENWQQNILTPKSAYPGRMSLTPPDKYSEDHDAVAITSTAQSSKVINNITLTKTKQQSTRRRRIHEHNVPPTALSGNNDIIAPKISYKTVRSRQLPVCTNVAETVFTYSNDETESTVDINQLILTQQNDSSTSKSGLHRIVEKVLSKRKKNRSKERFQHETQHNCNKKKRIQGTGPKVKRDKNRADEFPQGSTRMVNSRFMKRKFAKNIVTSLISIFNNSSCRMPKGVSSVMPEQFADPSIVEEPSEDQNYSPPLYIVDSGVTSVAERPGLHLLGSPPPVSRAVRLRD